MSARAVAVTRLLTAALAAIALSIAPAAVAGTRADKAAAQKLFRQGKQLLGKGDYKAALDKLRAAYQRDPSAETLLHIGNALRSLGKNLEALEAYETYLDDPEADPKKTTGVRRIVEQLDALVARLRIELAEPGAKVSLDDKEIDPRELGKEIRLEPGEHTVVAERDGRPRQVQKIQLTAHERRTVRVEFSTTPSSPAPSDPKVTSTSPQRVVGVVLMAAGGASVIAGAIATGVAVKKNREAAGHCLTASICDQTGVDLGRSAKSTALVATITVSAGVSAFVSGLVLTLTVPRSAEPAPDSKGSPKAAVLVSPTPGGAFLGVRGTF
jgi:hypothetical protein